MQPDQQPALRIDEPCPMSWLQLEGGKRKKFCGECQLHVHNAEEMTKREVHELVRASEQRVCMRIVTDQGGNPVFKSEPMPQESALSRRWRAAGLALAAGGLLAACQPSAAVNSSSEPSCGEPQTSGQTTATGAASSPVETPDAPHVLMGKIAIPPIDGQPEPTPEPLEIMGEVIAPEFGPETTETDAKLPQLDDLKIHAKPVGSVLLGRVAVSPPHGIELPAKPPIDPKPKR